VFDWLVEGRNSVYVVLAAVAVVLLLVWERTRERLYLYALIAVCLLAGLYFALDHLVETERKQVTRKVREMAAGVRARDVNAIFTHISERFNRNGVGKAAFRDLVDGLLRTRRIDEVEVWDFDFTTPVTSVQVPGESAPVPAIRVSFMAKPKGGVAAGEFGRCEARFIRDPDGQWRLFDFQVFNPAVDSNSPWQIPGL
jgi:hypothetical protein